MKILLKGGNVINVFTGEIEKTDVLMDEGKIIGVGNYSDADVVEDVSGKFICPGFIDGHIHIESTMLTPAELCKLCMPHGTTAIVADPHEIANVCGVDGIRYMMHASEGLPLHVYFTIPSCVPATPFDESGAELFAVDIDDLYADPRVVGLAEMMNYPGVIFSDDAVHAKIRGALAHGKGVDGHAPFLSGHDLDRYISAGIQSDHECSNMEEAKEKLRKGQWIMIRQGTAARNLHDLMGLFAPEFAHRCLLVTDDRHPADIMAEGHIDHIIRLAVAEGASAVTAIQMATIQAAQCFGLRYVGAVAPGYQADVLVMDDLDSVQIRDVYAAGSKVVSNGVMVPVAHPVVDAKLQDKVLHSFHTHTLTPENFHLEEKSEKCRVIQVIPGQLVTDEVHLPINWAEGNGVDTNNDVLKLAVIERHKNTGHIGLGFIRGIGLKRGAIASSVSHDSHNIIVIGTNETDMALAANHICEVGGNVVVADGEVIAQMPLPIAGLMSLCSGEEVARENELVREAVHTLGVNDGIEPFMNMAFVSLTVIPSLKMSTQGLVDVNRMERVDLHL